MISFKTCNQHFCARRWVPWGIFSSKSHSSFPGLLGSLCRWWVDNNDKRKQNNNNNKINRRKKLGRNLRIKSKSPSTPHSLKGEEWTSSFNQILKKSQKFNKEILHLKSRTIFFESHGCDPREDLLHPPVRNPYQFNYKNSFFVISKKSFRKGANSTFPQFVKIHLLQCFRRTWPFLPERFLLRQVTDWGEALPLFLIALFA